jgi:hypothetical protein
VIEDPTGDVGAVVTPVREKDLGHCRGPIAWDGRATACRCQSQCTK